MNIMDYQQLAPPPPATGPTPANMLHSVVAAQQQQQQQQQQQTSAGNGGPPPPQNQHPHIVVAPAHQQQPMSLPPAIQQHAHQIHAPLPSLHDDVSASSRWSQYQHMWRQHHVHINGKQGKDGPDEKKEAEGELWGNVEAQAAFLGPNLWDKTLPYDADLKVLNHYVDLDEFLSENGIPVDGTNGGPGAQNQPGNGGGGGLMHPGQLHKLGGGGGGGQNDGSASNGHQGPAGLHLEPITKRERSPSPSECCSPDTLNPPSPADSNSGDSTRVQYGLSLIALSMASSGRDFDPRTRAFSDEELKPQPMIKKSRKQNKHSHGKATNGSNLKILGLQFVPDDLKDDKYWARRRKNNMAAKRSRDARRMKENQIALRAGFLEKENMGLRQELDRLKSENSILRDKLSKYTDV
ncbi:hepatic leukemia factor-like isoform X10 [Trichogramma pretiosum]|uniref:hepatic leukemia factor-like isoform X10 n=1 Tax=Trichogramma pretiosum TaxID=7493 RepID=UPI000C71C368|nr:hepatic leukemia factor-like isoform X10 [Trichogramma pretiosum]